MIHIFEKALQLKIFSQCPAAFVASWKDKECWHHEKNKELNLEGFYPLFSHLKSAHFRVGFGFCPGMTTLVPDWPRDRRRGQLGTNLHMMNPSLIFSVKCLFSNLQIVRWVVFLLFCIVIYFVIFLCHGFLQDILCYTIVLITSVKSMTSFTWVRWEQDKTKYKQKDWKKRSNSRICKLEETFWW